MVLYGAEDNELQSVISATRPSNLEHFIDAWSIFYQKFTKVNKINKKLALSCACKDDEVRDVTTLCPEA